MTVRLLQKNSKWSIDEICSFDVSHIKKEILNFSKEWDQDTERQNTYVTHKDTKMYQLMFTDYSWTPKNKNYSQTINNFKSQNAKNQYNQIINMLEKLYSGKIVRSELVLLSAGKRVRKHIDQGNMLKISRRCHIPIITNDKVFFTVLNNTINMKEGTCYEINNEMPHGVENNSLTDRVHLILDIIELKYLV